MMTFYGSKMAVVQFATELQIRFGKDSQLTTITRQGKLGDYSVLTAIDTLSVDIVKQLAQTCCLRRTRTLSRNTQVG